MSDAEHAKTILDVIPGVVKELRREMRALAQEGIHPSTTVPQFRVLNRLNDGPLANREIAEWMGVTAPTASRMIDVLVRRGLVSRADEDPEDARRVRVGLTPLGRSRLAQLKSQVRDRMAERLAGLSPQKKQALSSGLSVLGELFSTPMSPNRRLLK